MMADGWEVTGTTPIAPQAAPQAAPTPAPSGIDPWTVVGQTAVDPNTQENQPSSLARFGHFLATGEKQDTDSALLDGAQDYIKGLTGSMAENLATAGRHIPGVPAQNKFTTIMQQIANEKPDTLAGMGGTLTENIAEWMVGEGELKALAKSAQFTKLAEATKILERYPRIAAMLGSHPEVAAHIPSAARQAAMGAVQTAIHGGSPTDILESGAIAGSLGLAAPIVGTPSKWIGALAKDVAPTTRMIEGVPFTQLASEAIGTEGQSLATKAQREAAQYASEPRVQAQRQQAFKQLQTNLAQKGIYNTVTQANEAMTAAGFAPEAAPGFYPETDIRRSATGQWRYYPPDGGTSLSESEARSVLGELKQRWLDEDLSPRQEARIRQAYNDISDQLARKQSYTINSPIGAPHDVIGATGGVNSFGGAADYLKNSAEQKLQLMGAENRSQYEALSAQRETAQDAFDRARYNPDDRAAAQARISDLNSQIEKLFQGSESTGSNAPEMMAQGLKEQRLGNAFQELQNTMDRHFNLRADVAEDTNRPRIAKGLTSMADDVQAIKDKYGDLLNPVLGDQGLNHITELADLLKPNGPRLPAAPKDFLGNVTAVWRKHLTGIRGIIAGGSAVALAHMGAQGLLGTAGGLGVLGTEAMHRMIVNRLATDPVLAEKMIYAMKNNVPPRVAAPLFAAMMSGLQGAQRSQAQEQQNADQQTQP